MIFTRPSCSPVIILFDGVCILCSKLVRFVIDRDAAKRFKFSPLQSHTARQLLIEQKNELPELNSIVLIYKGKAYYKSSAALRIAGALDGPWRALVILLIVPRILRDAVYDYVGNRRYRWFGRMNECWIPSEDVRDRFLR